MNRLLSFQWFLIFVILLKEVELLVDDHSKQEVDEEQHDHSSSPWSPIVEKKRSCPSESHELVFYYSNEVDHHSRLLMINETKVDSSEECAKICFEHHCNFAQFELKTSVCAFSVNTDNLDTHCKNGDKADTRVNKIVAEKDDEGFEIRCIECRRQQPVISESKDDNIQELIAEPKPSTTTIGYRQSCIVTFQVFMNEDINAFKTTRIATVSTINECAYICYQNSCSGAIYVPSSDGKAQCKVQMREKEKCNSKLQRHYTFTHEKAVVLSCFRCQPDKPITLSPDAEIIRATTTPRPELTKGRLTTIAPEKTDEATSGKEEGPVPPPESSNKVEDTPKSAKPPAMAPTESGQVNPESNAAEEPEATKSSDSDKSAEKTEPEKTSAKPDTASAEKIEPSKPAESGNTKSPTSEKPAETKDAEKPAESQKPEATTSSSPDTSGKTVSLGKVTTGPVDFGGCLITFQADYLTARPSEFKSEFELNLNVESPEICATRCYQDGCTGALYLSNNGTCVLGYGDKHHCNKRPLINFLNLKDAKNHESIWIHCTSCRSGKYGATGSVTGNMNNNKVEMGGQLADGKSLKAAETTDTTTKNADEKPTKAPRADATTAASKTDKSSEKVTEAEKSVVTEKPSEKTTRASEAEATAAETKAEQTTAEPKATSATPATEAEKPTITQKTEEKTTTVTSTAGAAKSEEKPTSSSRTPEKSAEEATTVKSSSKPSSDSEKPHKPEDTDGTQGCLITFQAGDLSQRPKEFTSEFELNLHTETPEICATRCYQDGCTGALFFPKNGTCVLGYGDKQYCDKSPILRFYKHSDKETHKESLWIHCTICRSQRHGETFEPVAEEKLQSTSN